MSPRARRSLPERYIAQHDSNHVTRALAARMAERALLPEAPARDEVYRVPIDLAAMMELWLRQQPARKRLHLAVLHGIAPPIDHWASDLPPAS